MKHIEWISNFSSETNGMIRGLLRKPGYAIAAWVMLGLAVTANAAVFAIVYGFLLKPMPYSQPHQISVVRERETKTSNLSMPLVSVGAYLKLKQNLDDIANAGLATSRSSDVVKIGGVPHLFTFRKVTPSLFRTLGTEPLIGRWPTQAAGQTGGPREALISDSLWHGAYGGSRRVLNDSIKFGGKSYRIVGVMPHGFFIIGSSADAWVPYVITPKRASNPNINYFMFVRRKPGVSTHQLNLALSVQQSWLLAHETPNIRALHLRRGFKIDSRPPHQLALTGYMSQLPWLLQAAAGLLLVLALANTINLGLVRQRARQHAFALRSALGSSRGNIARLILIEHLPIAITVGLTATTLTWGGIQTMHLFGLPPDSSPFKIAFAPPVIVFIWILSMLVVFIVALGPVIMATNRHAPSALGHGPSSTGGKTPRHVQRGLGVTQIALATALVIAGGLMAMSLWRVLSQGVGFTPQRRILATIALPDGMHNQVAAWQTLKPALLKLPNVRQATITGMAPFSGNINTGDPKIAGSPHTVLSLMPTVGADFFSTMSIPMEAGRVFTNEDVVSKASVAIINERLAKLDFGSARKAIGHMIEWPGNKIRIIGVMHDIHWTPASGQIPSTTIYLPFGAFAMNFSVVLRITGSTPQALASIKQTIRQALPGSVISRIQTFPNLVRDASVYRATSAGVVGTFASLAVLLAAIGVFAITAFIARARLGEYGIRAALGADPGMLLKLGFGEATWLLAIGLPIGLIGAYLLGRVIASALYQTPVFDIGLYVAGVVLIMGIVILAAWGPARRAARSPIRNLIGEHGTQ